MKHFLNKKIITFVLVVVLAIPPVFAYPKHGVEAAFPTTGPGAPVFDAANLGALGFINTTLTANTAANAANAATNATRSIFEIPLAAIGWLIGKIIIRSITISVIRWINSGFQGSPAFITDLNQFLIDLTDNVVGAFIAGTELGFLCDPFQLQIRIALANLYSDQFAASCTLTGIVDNIEGFFNNPIRLSTIGGQLRVNRLRTWEEFLAVGGTRGGNPYSASLVSRARLEAEIANVKLVELELLSYGRGWLSFRVCDSFSETVDANFGGGDPPTEFERRSAGFAGSNTAANCPIETPGSLIQNSLEDVFETGLNQLELADSINEIVNALIAQLILQVAGGLSSGLRSLSRPSRGGRSYLDRLRDDTSDGELIRQNLDTFDIPRFTLPGEEGFEAGTTLEDTTKEESQTALSGLSLSEFAEIDPQTFVRNEDAARALSIEQLNALASDPRLTAVDREAIRNNILRDPPPNGIIGQEGFEAYDYMTVGAGATLFTEQGSSR